MGHHSASTVVSALDARTVEAINNITHSALVQALTPFPRNIQSSSSLSSPPFAAAAVGTALLGADRTDGACENRSSSLSSEYPERRPSPSSPSLSSKSSMLAATLMTLAARSRSLRTLTTSFASSTPSFHRSNFSRIGRIGSGGAFFAVLGGISTV